MKRKYILLCILFLLQTIFCIADEYDEERGQSLLSCISSEKNAGRKLSAYLELAKLYEKNGDIKEAIDAYQKALKEPIKRADAYSIFILMGDLQLIDKQYARSIESYQEAIGKKPGLEEGHLKLARAYEESELFELAKEEYLYIIKKNQKSFDANFLLASIYLKQGFNTKALEYFKSALTIKADAGVFRKIAVCAENNDDMELAIAMLRQINSSETIYDDHINLGRLYKKQKNFKESESSFSRAISVNPGRVEAYIHLGLLYLLQNELVHAEKLLQIAQEKAPDEGVIRFFMGYIYYHQGKKRMALDEIKKSGELARTKALKDYARKFSDFLRRGDIYDAR